MVSSNLLRPTLPLQLICTTFSPIVIASPVHKSKLLHQANICAHMSVHNYVYVMLMPVVRYTLEC